MTKEEFEALLLKKGFDNETEESTFCKALYRYGGNVLKARFDCSLDKADFDIVSFEVVYIHGLFNYIIENSLFYDDMTEQKLDEILAQCTKIKTALTTIDQVSKGE